MNPPFKYGTGGKLGFLWPTSHDGGLLPVHERPSVTPSVVLEHRQDKSDDVLNADAARDNLSYRVANLRGLFLLLSC
jgi:hypothetical protein